MAIPPAAAIRCTRFSLARDAAVMRGSAGIAGLALAMTLFLCAAAPAVAAEKPSAPAAEKRVALVIGNAAYKGSPLANPVNDARDIAARLARLGYDVILKTDVGLRDMSRAVTQLGQRLSEGSVALVYYAGHGIQSKGRNFLVPVDAEIGQESSIRSEAVDVDQVLEQLQPARVSVVILDACRNNPFERRFRGAGGGGLAQMDAPKGTLIAYATAPGKVAMDGAGRNGLYTAELLRALDDPNRRIEDVFKQVRNNVARATGDQQIPWEASSLTGDLYLGGKPQAAAPAKNAAAVGAATDPAAFELEFWRSAEKDGKLEDYRAYLRKYPKGQFAELAQTRIGQLEQPVSQRKVASAPVAAAAQPPSVREELERAGSLLKTGSAGEAKRIFGRLFETLPDDSPYRRHAAYGLGIAQAADRMCANALKTLRRAADAWPDHALAPRAWREIAVCEKALHHPFRARMAAKTLLAQFPQSAEAEWARTQFEAGGTRPEHPSRPPR